jgi:hypothetical protein
MLSEKKSVQPIKAANGFCSLLMRRPTLSFGALILAIFAFDHAEAQVASNAGRRDDYFRLMPFYQHWTQGKGNQFAQFSVPLFVQLKLGRSMNVALRGSQAITSGDNLQKLRGLTDTQLAFNYGLANFIFNLGFNFPSGKRSLTYNEFLTTSLLSLNHYNFLIPNYGQGFNVSPAVTWAVPVGENLSCGLGVSYQYKGKFKPLAFVDDYDPGDEVLLTGGLDWRAGETAKLSFDLIFTFYGTDKIKTNKVFAAGNRIVTHVQFRQNFAHDELLLFARYLSRGKNSLAVGGALLPESAKSAPDQIEMIGLYSRRFNPRVVVGFLAEGRHFTTPAAADLYSSAGISIAGLGLTPEFVLSPIFRLPARFKYLFGQTKSGKKLSGVEIGIGMAARF